MTGAVKRVLVVGSWAKEQITIENIKKNADTEVFSYMDTKNPGIITLVNGYRIGSLYDVENVLNYAKEKKIELVIITTAGPLSAGLVDVLEKEDILVFGPNKQAARLEFDKAFTRQLMKKYLINAIPDFQVFDDVDKAIDFAHVLNWNVAVKPVGLTDGLGVRVFGDQLKTKEDVMNYIKEIYSKKISGSPRVIIEKKLEGVEFTLQCFVNGDVIIHTPAVQDFKKLLPGELGPNTASMGSYSDTGYLLPFMEQEDYDEAIDIIRKTLEAFQLETGKECSGFLYGQFMITGDGVKLIEYNFRPGDPEWLNTVYPMKNNLLDVIINLMDGHKKELVFENTATVCKYIVPKDYPQQLNQTLKISLDEKQTSEKEVAIYYSSGLDGQGNLNVGTERGIAFLAKGSTIFEAYKKVEEAISSVKGDFYYRSDIGTEELIKSKINYANRLRRCK
jgi:phosphoribosylamine--glycine ligase